MQENHPPYHPVFTPSLGDQVPRIHFLDEIGQPQSMLVENLYVQERIAPDEKCDSILAKIIYS
jgi:hypothetical protein